MTKDPRRRKFKENKAWDLGEYSRAEINAWVRYAIKLLDKEPDHARLAFTKLIAISMGELGINEYEIAYKLNRQVEWVNKLQKAHASGRLDWKDALDRRVFNGRHKQREQLIDKARGIAEAVKSHGMTLDEKISARDLASGITEAGHPTSYKQALELLRIARRMERGDKILPVSKENTIFFRYLAIHDRLLDSNGKPKRFNKSRRAPSLTPAEPSKHRYVTEAAPTKAAR